MGIAAGVVSLVAFIPYIASILRGKTKPSRATWLILSLTAAITLASYREAVNGTAIWVARGYVIATIVVFLLSIKRGVGGWEGFDQLAFGGCAATLGLWAMSNSAELALFAILATDLVGLLPTMRKTLHNPETENSLAWILSFAASLLSLLIVDGWSFLNFAYPAYLTISSGTIAALSLRKNRTFSF